MCISVMHTAQPMCNNGSSMSDHQQNPDISAMQQQCDRPIPQERLGRALQSNLPAASLQLWTQPPGHTHQLAPIAAPATHVCCLSTARFTSNLLPQRHMKHVCSDSVQLKMQPLVCHTAARCIAAEPLCSESTFGHKLQHSSLP